MPFEKERQFHQERWEKKAKESPQGILSKIKGEKAPTSEDVMRTEAERDNADFEKRQHVEFLEWQKSLQVVIENFKEKVKNPENKEIGATLIVILGGGMKSAYSAGQVIGLNMVGITADKVDAVVGTSGGAVAATAYVAGPEQTLRGAAMLTGPLGSKDFIDTGVSRLGETVKLRMMKELMEKGEYKLDVDAVQNSKTELWYTVTLPVEGSKDPEVKFLNAKKIEPSMVDGIVSSMSIPFATGKIPEIDGVKYYDGGFRPLPIKELIEKFKAKNILILPQTPFETMDNIKPTRTEYNLASLARTASLNQLEKGLVLKQQLRESLEHIQKEKGVNIGIMWPPDANLSTLTIDGNDMKAAILESARDTIKQIGGTQPDEIKLYEPTTEESGQKAA